MTARPTLSEVVVHRVNHLPVEALDLGLPGTLESLLGESGLERQLAEWAEPLSDALHAAVPGLEDDPALRRAALAVRRAVHNQRPAKVPDSAVLALAWRLGDEEGALLTRWQDGVRRLAALRTVTETHYATETARATARLRDVLNDHGLGQGVALASPHLLGHLTAKPLEPHGKATRSVLAYVSRAAVKTSPFSRLTELTLDGQKTGGETAEGEAAEAETAEGETADGPSADSRQPGGPMPDEQIPGEQRPGEQGPGEQRPREQKFARGGRLSVAQQHVRDWVDTLARDERCATLFETEPNRSPREVAGRLLVLLPSYGGPGEAAWRTDEVADASRHRALVEEIGTWPRATIAATLERIGGADPFGGFVRLLDTGWLRLVLPWETGEERPLLALARRLERLADPALLHTARCLRTLDDGAAELAGLDGPARAAAVERLARRVAGGPEEAPRPAVPYTVYEDTLSDVPVHLTAPAVREDLTALGERIRPYVFRSHLYDWMRDEFVAAYGSGGRCRDAFAFLWRLAAAPDFDSKLFQALRRDHQESGSPTERAWLPVSASSAPPTTAVLYQIAAGGPDDLARGRHRTVVNQYNSGVGGLLARFRRLLDTPAPSGDLTEQLRDWIGGLFPEAAPREVTLSGDVNGMHEAAEGVLPPLRWPNEPARSDEAYDPEARVALRHDPADDTLTLTLADEADRVVAPVYLGVVPQHLVPGPARLLLCLADPWVNGSRMCCTRNPVEVAPPPTPGAVDRSPRSAHGRLVLRRETWRLEPGLLPRPEKGEEAAAFFRRVHRWRTSHGMPEEVFLSVENPPGDPGSTGAAAKPLWLSFASPHAIWAAVNHVKKAPRALAVRLSEACPDRSGYWLRDHEGHRRAAEHVSLLRWERAAAPAVARNDERPGGDHG
ncbi:hypothetical protein [Streptomyces iconiensis]|uniref:Lantibiotic dehydratase, C terminus n=1 Tax=Streptomyces iconiensis TaxID=1384038 RepID=A0ABT6ZUR8_9ACTN|nr:hypothetical protein [Streptomyces iconiensis]MDJ1132798.1 hypothetical protein [Streptomyces iconiensis]